MKTIKDFRGKVCYSSNELYVLQNITTREQNILSDKYQNGSVVRLISGVDDSNTIGYHFNKDYVTVCSIYVAHNVAEFVGVKKSQIKLIK